MRGKVYLIKKGFGKILIDDKETPLMNLPESFEDGDEVDVEFENNDLNKRVLKLVAYSRSDFGFVSQMFNPTTGVVVVTYPELKGTVLIKGNFKVGDKLQFDIKKIQDSQFAVNIRKTDSFKAGMPVFGEIEEKVISLKEGFIKDIVEVERVKGSVKGKIKVIKSDRGFGFIESDGFDAFFMINWYKAFYKKEPKVGDKVEFLYREQNGRYSVSKFVKSKKLKSPYLILDNNKKISLKQFENFYKRPPRIGDIVNYLEYQNRIVFSNNELKINTFKPFRKLNRGEIKFVKENYGFVKTEKGDYFFSVDKFKNVYEKTPQKGDKVFFSYRKSNRGFEVVDFYKKELEIKENHFKNFVILEKGLYYVYVENEEVKEVFKCNFTLNEAKSIYKNRFIPDEFRLKAVNVLIEEGYESKKVSRKDLINLKIELLEKLKNKNFEYEIELQKLRYNPKELSKKAGKKLELLDLKEVKPLNFNEKKLSEIKIKKAPPQIKINDMKFDLLVVKPLRSLSFEEIKFEKIKFKEIKKINFRIKPWNLIYKGVNYG